MIKLAKKLLIILLISIFMISVLSATAYAVELATEKNIVEFKEKKATSFKIKWDANEGKIGNKKTVTSTVKKGTKVKLVTSPKRVGYIFQGWFTKKTGGTKITKNTKPTKSLTYYAQWKKVLNNNEKKLVGEWKSSWDGRSAYTFYSDGSYISVSNFDTYDWGFKGYYSVKNGILTLRYQHAKDYNGIFLGVGFNSKYIVWSDWETSTPKALTFSTEDGKQYMRIGSGIWYTKVSN